MSISVKRYIIRFSLKNACILRLLWYNLLIKVSGGIFVIASYDKLWKLLIDRKMKKGELCKLANVSHSTLAKLRHGENVNIENLKNICEALDCKIEDIVEFVRE